MVPKNLALAAPDRAALALAPALTMTIRPLKHVIAGLNWIANHTLRALGVEPRDEVASAFTRDEVAGFVEESQREGLLDPSEKRLLLGALQFEERDARCVLLAPERLVTVAPDVTPEEVEATAARTGYSRFPVRDLTGYVHLKDAIARERPLAIRPLARVRTTDRLRAVLATMQRANSHLARVEDEQGALAGVVALEDVLEELVGEIRDEAQRLAV
jgi:magnesium and cobalt exporter, CNNM family